MMRQAVALVCLQALDLWTTWEGLDGGALERNPVGLALLGGAGFAGLVGMKAIGTAVILITAAWLWRGKHPLNPVQAVVGLQVCCAAMLAVVGWNSWVLFIHGAV